MARYPETAEDHGVNVSGRARSRRILEIDLTMPLEVDENVTEVHFLLNGAMLRKVFPGSRLARSFGMGI